MEHAALKLNLKKAALMKSSVCFLGVQVEAGEHTPDPENKKLIQNLPLDPFWAYLDSVRTSWKDTAN